MRPNFTPDEQYLLSTVRSSVAARGANAFAWGYLLGSAILAGLGAFTGIVELIYIGSLLLFGFRLYEMYYERQWAPIWRNVIEKYEQAVCAAAEPTSVEMR
jgi:hypothetical protein